MFLAGTDECLLEEKRVSDEEDLIAAFQYLKGPFKKDGERLLMLEQVVTGQGEIASN